MNRYSNGTPEPFFFRSAPTRNTSKTPPVDSKSFNNYEQFQAWTNNVEGGEQGDPRSRSTSRAIGNEWKSCRSPAREPAWESHRPRASENYRQPCRSPAREDARQHFRLGAKENDMKLGRSSASEDDWETCSSPATEDGWKPDYSGDEKRDTFKVKSKSFEKPKADDTFKALREMSTKPRDAGNSLAPPDSKKIKLHVEDGIELPETLEQWSDYILSARDLSEGSSRCTWMKFYRPRDVDHDVNNLELHHLVRHGEGRWINRFINECVLEVGHDVFWKGFIVYTSTVLYNNDQVNELLNFRMAFNNNSKQLKREDFMDLFLSCAHSHSSKDAEIYSTLCMIYPSLSPKLVNKALGAMMKRGEDPPCLEIFSRAICYNPTSVNFKRDDGGALFRKFVHICFERYVQEPDPYIENPMGISKRRLDTAQEEFVKSSLHVASTLFNNLSSIKGQESPLDVFLDNYEKVEIKHNLELFQTYFFAYFRIGMFDLTKGYHLIAWNRYFDDRYYHDDNSWIFESDKISSEMDWKVGWDYQTEGTDKELIKTHVYLQPFKMLGKLFDLFKLSDKAGVMKKYGQDEFVQYFAIALAFLGEYDKFDKLYEHFNGQYTEGNVHLCLNINALFIAAKRQDLKRVLALWLEIAQHFVEKQMLEEYKINDHQFKVPRFVGLSQLADIATKILRNCIYFQAVKEGTEGFLKYGMLLLFMARENWDKFVPFNIIENVLNAIPKDKFETTLKGSFAEFSDLSNSKIWKQVYANFPETHKTIFENGAKTKKLFANKRCGKSLTEKLLEMYNDNHPVTACLRE